MFRAVSPSIRRAAAPLLAVVLCVLTPLAATGVSIDPWPHYQPQRTCSPAAKPGTLKLAAWLQSTYPGSGSYGISRACSSGGTSEHKEGRAFDWRVNAGVARENRYAHEFMRRAFATDASGNKAALARRMGIMYVIYDDHIYSATYHYRARPYKNAGCRAIATCGATLRHRDHMHISLTWAGARAQTSWYSGRMPTTQPPPRPGRQPDPAPAPRPGPAPVREDIYLPSSTSYMNQTVPVDGSPVTAHRKVHAGSTYKVTVFGLARYGDANARVSDAVCSWDPARSTWSATPDPAARTRFGSLDLTVNGHRLFGQDCHTGAHVYQAKWTPQRSGPVTLRVDNTDAAHTRGALRVVVSGWTAPVRHLVPDGRTQKPAPTTGKAHVSDRWTLEDYVDLTEDERSAATPTTLQAGVAYDITVSGVVRLEDEVYTDGQCLYLDGRWEQRGSLDLRTPDRDHGNLYVDGTPFAGKAPAEDRTGCTTHVHTMRYTPARTSQVRFALWDPFRRSDNRGDLDITVSRATPVPLPAAPDAGGVSSARDRAAGDRITVSSDDADGVDTRVKYAAGDKVRIRVYGGYTVNDRRAPADASCVATYHGWTPTPETATGQDLYAMTVAGQLVDWKAMTFDRWWGWRAADGDCSSDHAYQVIYTVPVDGPLRFTIFDLDYRDNTGAFTVEVKLA